MAHARYLKGAQARKRKVSWHFTVDDKRVVKHLRTTEKGLPSGDAGGNRQSVGIEICENRGIDQETAIDRACLLTAVLMHAQSILPSRIVPHKLWSGKHCPRIILDSWPGGMAQFVDRSTSYLTALHKDADEDRD